MHRLAYSNCGQGWQLLPSRHHLLSQAIVAAERRSKCQNLALSIFPLLRLCSYAHQPPVRKSTSQSRPLA